MKFGKISFNAKSECFKGMTKSAFKKKYSHFEARLRPFTINDVWEHIKRNRNK